MQPELQPSQDQNQTTPPASSPRQQRSPLTIITIVLVLIAIAVGAFWWWSSLTPSDKLDKAEAAAAVTINAEGLTPPTVKISQNQSLTWVNQDKRPHKVTFDQSDLTELSSDEQLNTGDTYSVTLEKKGIYTYHDALNPTSYRGTIIVE